MDDSTHAGSAEPSALAPGVSARTPISYWAGAAAASTVALALGALHLGAKSFWLDEAFSVAASDVHNDVRHVLLADGGNFAFYYLLLHLWLQGGDGDAWVRLLSVLFAAAAPALLFLAGRRLVGCRAAVFAAGVMACNPFFVLYAQEARGYSLLLALSILSTYLFVLCLETQARGVRMAYVGVSTLMLYTHLFGIWVILSHAVFLMVGRLQPGVRARLGLALAAVAALGIPLAHYALQRGPAPVAWIATPSWHSLLSFVATLAGSRFLLVAYSVLVAVGVWSGVRHGTRLPTVRDDPWLFLVVWFGVPVILTLLVSLTFQPIFVPRYLIVVLPPVALAVGVGISKLRSTALAATCGVLVLLSAAGVQQAYAAPKDDWRAAVAAVARHQRPGDVILYDPPWLKIPFQHAYQRLPQRVHTAPRDLSPAWAPPGFDAPPGWRAELRSPRRVWLVVGARGPEIKPAFINLERREAAVILRALPPRRAVGTWSFAGIEVCLYATEAARQPVRGSPVVTQRRRDVR